MASSTSRAADRRNANSAILNQILTGRSFMDEPTDRPQFSRAMRLRSFSVHILTALGGGVALVALLEAVREHWAAMFAWLGLALLIDGLDGPLARRLDVGRVLPDWSGDTLDLVVDFVTYVFVPAYAITASGLLIPLTTPILGIAIVVSGALYFADRRMKTDDNHFRGFPALWNGAAFYLFLLKPPPAVSSLALALLVMLTFVPFNVLHPLRTNRFRKVNIALIAAWAVLAIFAVFANFEVPLAITLGLCAIALYILCADIVVRAMNWKSA
jgi:phosphatidylcholine synthase